ncbi:MAG: DNA polymerase III subunit delta [Halofilum sp. (in: g-proteobacteria)]|nr:DNA polymerase III subunit delta [Halofilum sp. (in: g-proteobacteria)]
MQLRPDQLPRHLAGELAPVYLVTGDEPLQHAEAADAIRGAAREQGYAAREVYDAGSDFDWGRLGAAADNLSLFAERRLVDLRLPGGKPGREGGATLAAWAERPPEDTLLLVTTPKIDPQARRAAWYKALERAGVVVAVWPLDPGRLPAWIRARMRARELQPSDDALALLAARVEGNLLAAAQEIDKLLLLGGPGRVDAERVAEVVADAARWSVFDLADAVLDGAPERVARIAAGLRAEGTQPPVVAWALQRELAQVAGVAARRAEGQAMGAALAAAGVWQRRQQRVRGALARFDARAWQRLVARCARLERLAKGAARGSFWDELVESALAAAGAPVPGLSPRRAVEVER